jgi:hypothetical protein
VGPPKEVSPVCDRATLTTAAMQVDTGKPTAATCQCHADVWREGFRRGFGDALRLAARRLPPETWHTLDALADEYGPAG